LSTREERFARGSFAGWKLDVVHAIVSDARLQPSDVRVAVAMMRFLSAGDLSLYPSQERLAAITSMSRRNVVDCLSRLKDAGWIVWDRGNRQLSNVYRFDAGTVADQLARVKRDEQENRARRKGRKRSSDVQPAARQKANPEVNSAALREVKPTSHQHLNGNSPTETSGLEDVA
jgi:biotin operon repressor